jgi:hypothetical protein
LEVPLQYFDPCLVIVHVCTRFHLLPPGLKIYVINFVIQTLGLNNFCSTLDKLSLVSNHPKKSNIQKHVLMLFIQVLIINLQFTLKFFIIMAPSETLLTFQFIQCTFSYISNSLVSERKEPNTLRLKGRPPQTFIIFLQIFSGSRLEGSKCNLNFQGTTWHHL